jgi:four helix bundle protein
VQSEFRDLAAYTRAAALADELHETVIQWRSVELWTTGVQLLRSADSIGANIAEAAGRWGYADKTKFLVIARGSLYETEHWIARAIERKLLDEEQLDALDGIARALSGLIKANRI